MPIFIGGGGGGADERVWKTEALTASDLGQNITLATPGSSIGGLALAGGPHRILLRDQTDATQNGIYTWDGAATLMVRTDDADTSDELNTSAILVDQGNSANGIFIINANDQQALDSGPGSEVTVTKVGSTSPLTEGDGINISSNVVSVQTTGPLGFDTGQPANQRDLIIESSGTAGQTLLSSGTVLTPPSWGALDLTGSGVTGTLPVTSGGTGQTSTQDVIDNFGIKDTWCWTALIDSNSIVVSQDARHSGRGGFQTNFQPFECKKDCTLVEIAATCRTNVGGWSATVGTALPHTSSLSLAAGVLNDRATFSENFSAGDLIRLRFQIAGGGTDVRDVVIHAYFKEQ